MAMGLVKRKGECNVDTNCVLISSAYHNMGVCLATKAILVFVIKQCSCNAMLK